MAEVKREVREVIADVRNGGLERGVGAVVFQGYNVLLKALETERKIAEQDELMQRIAVLEEYRERGLLGWSTDDENGGDYWRNT